MKLDKKLSYRFVTMHTLLTDGQTDTDRQKGLRNTVRCITCSRTVKTDGFSRVCEFESVVGITSIWKGTL